MTDHNRGATNSKIALSIDRAQATSCGSQDPVREVWRDCPIRRRTFDQTPVLFGECIRLASRYVTSLENQLHSLLRPSPSALHLAPHPARASSLPPAAAATALANHRCNPTQPSRNRSDPSSPRSLLIFLRTPHCCARYIFLPTLVAFSFLYTSQQTLLRDDRLLNNEARALVK